MSVKRTVARMLSSSASSSRTSRIELLDRLEVRVGVPSEITLRRGARHRTMCGRPGSVAQKASIPRLPCSPPRLRTSVGTLIVPENVARRRTRRTSGTLRRHPPGQKPDPHVPPTLPRSTCSLERHPLERRASSVRPGPLPRAPATGRSPRARARTPPLACPTGSRAPTRSAVVVLQSTSATVRSGCAGGEHAAERAAVRERHDHRALAPSGVRGPTRRSSTRSSMRRERGTRGGDPTGPCRGGRSRSSRPRRDSRSVNATMRGSRRKCSSCETRS